MSRVKDQRDDSMQDAEGYFAWPLSLELGPPNLSNLTLEPDRFEFVLGGIVKGPARLA